MRQSIHISLPRSAWERTASALGVGFVCITLLVLMHTTATPNVDAQANNKAKPANDWPVFRGNAHQTGVATSELPEKLEILWSFKAKEAVEATAAIADGTVFIGSFDEHLYALDLQSGKLKWKFKDSALSVFGASAISLLASAAGPGPMLAASAIGQAKDAVGAPIKVAAAFNNGAVYFGDEYGKFFCLDTTSGAKKWAFDTEAEISSAPNFDGHRVLFGCGDQLLYCMDKEKGGKPLWTFKVPGGPVMGSPAIIESKTFVAGCDSEMHVIDTITGKESHSVELDGQVGATPALVGDFLYVGNMSHQVQAINWKLGKVVWTYEAKKRAQDFFASVAATPDLILAGSRDRCLHALDRKTGEVKWVYATGGKVDSSPVVAGKRVYFGSSDGKLYVVDLASGNLVQTIELGKEILASPAVSGDRLVIGTTGGVVYCLGKK